MANNLNGKKILIAGAGGLLGSQLVKKVIDEGGYVYAGDFDLVSTQDKLNNLNIDGGYELHQLDLTRLEYVHLIFAIATDLD